MADDLRGSRRNPEMGAPCGGMRQLFVTRKLNLAAESRPLPPAKRAYVIGSVQTVQIERVNKRRCTVVASEPNVRGIRVQLRPESMVLWVSFGSGSQ